MGDYRARRDAAKAEAAWLEQGERLDRLTDEVTREGMRAMAEVASLRRQLEGAVAETERLRGLLRRALNGLECEVEDERREVWESVMESLDPIRVVAAGLLPELVDRDAVARGPQLARGEKVVVVPAIDHRGAVDLLRQALPYLRDEDDLVYGKGPGQLADAIEASLDQPGGR